MTQDIPSMAAAPFYAGHMLLAMPAIGDSNFEHSAIALCSHDDKGALGLDLGHVVDGLGLRDFLANFDIEGDQVPDVPILRGGPVEPQRGFVLHSSDWRGDHLLPVGDDWCLSGSLDVLQAIAAGTGPAHYQVALGYAGWGAGQLEEEILENGWFPAGNLEAELLSHPPRERWSAAFARSGVDVRLLSGLSGSA